VTASRSEPGVADAATNLRVACFVNHFFGESWGDLWARVNPRNFQSPKSYTQTPEVRRRYVERTLERLASWRDLARVARVAVFVCGSPRRSLVPVDLDMGDLPDPRLMGFETLPRMGEFLDDYDYFVNVEDDLLVGPEVLDNVVRFDAVSPLRDCLHPNRFQEGVARRPARDIPPTVPGMGWTDLERVFEGRVLRVSVNPHAGILVLSRRKLEYCLERVDRDFVGQVIEVGGRFVGGPMASAYAHYHRPFDLYRPYEDPHFHAILHQELSGRVERPGGPS